MLPHFKVLLAGAVWGSSGLFIKYLQLPPTTLSFFRLGVPTVLMAIYLLTQKKVFNLNKDRRMLIASVLNAIRLYLYIFAFSYTKVGSLVVVLYTMPIFTTILSAIFLKEKVSRKTILAIALAFAGVLLVYHDSGIVLSDHLIGMTAMLCSAFIYAITIVIYKGEMEKYDHYEAIFFQNFVGAVVFLPFLFINSPFPTWNEAAGASVFGLVIGVFGFGLYFSALKALPVSVISCLTYVEVVSAIGLAALFLGESLSWNLCLGAVLVVSAAFIVQRASNKPQDLT